MQTLVFLVHSTGEFLATVEHTQDESAVDKATEWAAARHLDVEQVWIATADDIDEAEGQVVEIPNEN
jgi:hypothetical protein